MVVAKWAWVAAGDGQLHVDAGAKLRLVEQTNESWWMCKSGAEQGFVPSNYLEMHEPDLELHQEYLDMLDSGELMNDDVRDICTEEALFIPANVAGQELLSLVRNYILRTLGQPVLEPMEHKPLSRKKTLSMNSMREYVEMGALPQSAFILFADGRVLTLVRVCADS